MKKITIALLFALTFLFSGCGGAIFSNYDEKFDGIRLKLTNSVNGDESFSHPSQLTPAYASNVVASLFYKMEANDEIFRIFDKKDVQDIAGKLIGTFQQADGNERIQFNYYGKSARETKGFTYIDENGKWNWVFKKINGVIYDSIWRIYPGKYFQYKSISTLIQGDVVKRNWVLTGKSDMPDTISGIAGVSLKKSQGDAAIKKQKYDSKKELNKINDANERLRFLKKLFEGGFITEEDYENQKQRIIDRM